MDFHSPPTLFASSSTAVIATLFCHRNCKALYPDTVNHFNNIVHEINSNMCLLPLPKSVIDSMESQVWPIGEQIKTFLLEHTYIVEDEVSVYGKFSWTPLTLCNWKQTAINILDDCCLDDITAFHLAGVNCLEEKVRQMWPNLISRFTNVAPEGADYLQFSSSEGTLHECLIPKWVLLMVSENNDVLVRDESAELQFSESVNSGNVDAAAYFLKKVKPSRRNELVKTTTLQAFDSIVHDRYRVKVMVFLLSEMSEKTQDIVFGTHSEDFLWWFVDCLHLSKFFIPLCKRLWKIQPGRSVCTPTAHFISNILIGCGEDIFREYWLKCPTEEKTQCVAEIMLNEVYPAFIPFNPEEVLAILCDDQNASENLRNHLLTNSHLVRKLFLDDDQNSNVLYFIQQCFPSATERDCFKELFLKYTHKSREALYQIVSTARCNCIHS